MTIASSELDPSQPSELDPSPPYSCRAAVRCPKASSARTETSRRAKGQTISAAGSLAYSSQVRQTFYIPNTYTLLLPYLIIYVPTYVYYIFILLKKSAR